MKSVRIAKLAASTLAGVALIVLVLAVLINLRDPEISAQARAMAHFERTMIRC